MAHFTMGFFYKPEMPVAVHTQHDGRALITIGEPVETITIYNLTMDQARAIESALNNDGADFADRRSVSDPDCHADVRSGGDLVGVEGA